MFQLKKYFTAAHIMCLCFLLILLNACQPARAQTKVGIKLSPVLVTSRTDGVQEGISVSSNTAGIRIIPSIILERTIGSHYTFNTGLGYISKPLKIDFSESIGAEPRSIEKDYTLQYLQIPLTLKMLTNEFSIDKRFYFEAGTLAQVLLNKKENEQPEVIRSFHFMDFSLYAGAGIEYRLGVSTVFSVGLAYNRGLVNLVNKSILGSSFSAKSDNIGIEALLKF